MNDYIVVGIVAVSVGGLLALFANVAISRARKVLPKGMLDIGGPWKCPDCGEPIFGFLMGPSGGLAQNILCGSCFHEYNVLIVSEKDIRIIDDNGTADVQRRRVFGIREES